MTATSHAITGTAIALIVKEPVLAMPLALVSHFVLDSLPHFGPSSYAEIQKNKTRFNLILAVDAFLLTVFIGFLFLSGASWISFACLFLAGCPDFAWAYRYIFQENFGAKSPGPMNALNRFHSKIQRQTLKGIIYETPYTFLVLLFVIMNL